MNEEFERIQEATRKIRDMLLDEFETHRANCPHPDVCHVELDTMAFLCHCAGIHSEHMEELGLLIDRADKRCQSHKHDELCRN